MTVNPQITISVCWIAEWLRISYKINAIKKKKKKCLHNSTEHRDSSPQDNSLTNSVTSYNKMLYLILRKRHINCSLNQLSHRFSQEDSISFSLRAWELDFNHDEMARSDDCITGFIRLKSDLEAHNRPRKISQRDPHWEGCLCMCWGMQRTDLFCICIVW